MYPTALKTFLQISHADVALNLHRLFHNWGPRLVAIFQDFYKISRLLLNLPNHAALPHGSEQPPIVKVIKNFFEYFKSDMTRLLKDKNKTIDFK